MPIRFDHVALGLWKVSDAPAVLAGELGARPSNGGPGGAYSGGQWEFANAGRIETLEPAGEPGGFLHRFLESRGPGIHHVTFKVPSLREVCDRAEAGGYAITGYDDRYEFWKEAFLHPKQAQGIVVQFAESYPDPDDSWRPDWVTLPDSPSLGPVDVVGPRLSCASIDRARLQWEEILHGRCEERGDSLVFSWPDSPMRIVVDIDPDRPEGPRWIEVRSDRTLGLPDEPYATLGTRFVQIDG